MMDVNQECKNGRECHQCMASDYLSPEPQNEKHLISFEGMEKNILSFTSSCVLIYTQFRTFFFSEVNRLFIL